MFINLIPLIVKDCGSKCVWWKTSGGCQKIDNREDCPVLEKIIKELPILTLLKD